MSTRPDDAAHLEPSEGSDQEGPVRLHLGNSVLRLTLDVPATKNALSRTLLSRLYQGLLLPREDEHIRAVVLTATGSVFCSGADLNERLHPREGGVGDDTAMASVPDVLEAIRTCPCPVLARVNGHVRAGGTGLVAAADIAVSVEQANFAFSEVRVGVAPAMIAVAALPVMGRRSLQRFALSGAVFTATEAMEAGLLTAVVADLGALDAWVDDMLEAIHRGAPVAIAETKRLLRELAGEPWARAMADAQARSDRLFQSGTGREGMAAFLAKRAPEWVVKPS